MPPYKSYAKLVLSDGWYRDLYLKAVADYEARGLIDRETFIVLTPLYPLSVALTVLDVQRLQEETMKTWLRRMAYLVRSIVNNTRR